MKSEYDDTAAVVAQKMIEDPDFKAEVEQKVEEITEARRRERFDADRERERDEQSEIAVLAVASVGENEGNAKAQTALITMLHRITYSDQPSDLAAEALRAAVRASSLFLEEMVDRLVGKSGRAERVDAAATHAKPLGVDEIDQLVSVVLSPGDDALTNRRPKALLVLADAMARQGSEFPFDLVFERALAEQPEALDAQIEMLRDTIGEW